MIQGELYYMAIRSEEKLTELMEWQVQMDASPCWRVLCPHARHA